jgi:hypothetical protein
MFIKCCTYLAYFTITEMIRLKSVKIYLCSESCITDGSLCIEQHALPYSIFAFSGFD